MIKKKALKIVSLLGYNIHKRKGILNPSYQLLTALKKFDIDIILDIGANSGQFSMEIRNMGFNGKIVSFEPLLQAHTSLSSKAAKDCNWIIHKRCAIGDYNGEVNINVSNNSVSSSILPIMQKHTSAEPNSKYSTTEITEIFKLDALVGKYIEDASNVFLKIDTQGFESQVLDGASATLPAIKGIACELSLVELYEDQTLWLDILGRLEKLGFKLWALQPEFTDPKSGQTLQMNGVFFRV